MHYRREIDGLRAVAVIPVILFHAGLGPFDGGFAGVDVFFVISGYLIAGIVLDDIDAGRFTLPRFYERRIRRIVPALFVMMAALVPLFWSVMTPAQFRELGAGMAAAALSVANILYFYVAGYFDTAAELKPLLHTWSLAVEEQFYIVFPLAAAWLWPRGRRTFAIAMIAVTALSFAAAVFSASRWPDAAFYLPHTRAFELGIGVLAALAMRN
ncbi:MAG: acyltransferase, partial [Rhizobiaceae bacterium]